MPINLIGKIDRKKLSKQFKKECEILKKTNLFNPNDDLNDEIIKKLIELWNEILPIQFNQNDINRSFFEVGGNSLLLFLLNVKLSKVFTVGI